MKKILFTSIVLLFTSFTFLACSDDDDDYTWKKFSEIPASAQQFVKDHFSAQDGTFDETSIVEIKQEKNGDYEVKFSNRVEVDFYTNGVWKEIDTNGNTLPNSTAMLIPEKALNYISTKYPTAIIEEIEKQGAYSDTQNIKIELRDDRDIIFDYLGNVISDHGATSGDDDQVMKPEELHAKIQAFLNTYFEGKTPDLVKKEWDEYEVVFNNDTKEEVEIEFTADYKPEFD